MAEGQEEHREAFEQFVIRELGPDALAGGKTSVYEAAKRAWDAAIDHSRAESGRAKELVEALEAIVSSSDYGAEDDRPLMQQARAALAKAKPPAAKAD